MKIFIYATHCKIQFDLYNYTVSQKGFHPSNGYNFVNSWRICKILCKEQYISNKTDISLPTTP